MGDAEEDESFEWESLTRVEERRSHVSKPCGQRREGGFVA